MSTKDEINEIAELIVEITNRFINYPVPSWDEFKILLEKEISHDTSDPDENVFGGADLNTPTMPYLFLTETVQEYGDKGPIEIGKMLKNVDDTKLIDLRFKFNLANLACETIFGEWKREALMANDRPEVINWDNILNENKFFFKTTKQNASFSHIYSR